MTTRRSHVFPLLVLLAAGLGFVLILAWRDDDPSAAVPAAKSPAHQSGRALPPPESQRRAAPVTGTDEVTSAPSAPAMTGPATRAEAAKYLLTVYRREQVARELALEQQRYGLQYWSRERTGPELDALQHAKAVLAQELSAEAEAVLRDLFPGEAGEGIALTPLFDADHPGPQVGFLAEAERARFEMALAERTGPMEAGVLLALAQQLLSPEDFAAYRRWNDPAAAALRARLAGFGATEAEFQALLADGKLAPEESPAERAARLTAQLGARRYGELAEWEDPALRTATADLRRRGLAPENARWLAATRAQAIAAIQNTWADARLDVPARQQRVAQIGQTYAQAIATQLALPAASLDELFSPPANP